MTTWKRCDGQCEGENTPVVSLQVQLSTFGGADRRVQVRAESRYLCEEDLGKVIAGRVPQRVRTALAEAVEKLRTTPAGGNGRTK